MNDRLESFQRRDVTQNARSQLVAIDLAARGGARKRRLDRRRGLPLAADTTAPAPTAPPRVATTNTAPTTPSTYSPTPPPHQRHSPPTKPACAAAPPAPHPDYPIYCSRATSGSPRITK